SRSLYQAGALSSQVLEGVQTRTEAAQAQVEQLEAALTQSQAALQNTEITAPFDGIIAARYLEAGDMVGPGLPVFRIVDMRKVKVVGDVSQERLGRLRVGLPARVRVSSYPGEVFEGTVSNISPVLDPLTRLATLEVEVPNAEERLRPGMFSEMEIVLSSLPDALLLPIDALIDEYRYLARESFTPSPDGSAIAGSGAESEASVFVVENGHARARHVRIGLMSADQVQIAEGLQPGEVVVTAGRYRLSDGDPVRTTQQTGSQEGGPR
ncbi:efflux RND transporter periplasmic adaptor subunit, partial [Gemmatimonadota bacterium]